MSDNYRSNRSGRQPPLKQRSPLTPPGQSRYTPGSAIVLRESSGPVSYRFGKTVTYVTRSGRVLDAATVKSKIRVGVPVRVHYAGTGPNMVVDRVVLEQD